MTIALGVLVNDGLVIAADSATTLMGQNRKTGAVSVFNVYESANKIFNLYKGLPIGGYTFGAGAIGDASIATLAKDFRAELTDVKPIGPAGWVFDPNAYTIEEVAIAARQYLYEDRYVAAFAKSPQKPVLGFFVGGYSTGEGLPELWQVFIDDKGACAAPTAVKSRGTYGVVFSGEPEAIQRLLFGYGTGLPTALEAAGVPKADIPAMVSTIQGKLEVPLAPPAMPIQDVIKLAEFLTYLTIQFSAFKPGAPTVGGPIEIAAITKHEGFKWVSRKHYFDNILNP
jgi:hypothetical protein